ncbi:nucleotidyltransferase domain-containing protein [Kribbella sp. NPDC051718]|uniref:nucleotidyltransferase domain-containing protein n=1 Tax=Kribbella sp. NPDC051718 TaxID=3155168 RepID=UPI003427F12B
MLVLDDEEFLAQVVAKLAGLPGVTAVALGGSRAQRIHRADSDWDLGIYYRGSFDPQDLRELGWSGEVFELGAWGGGIFNGGAWLQIDGRKVDVHYRDLAVTEHVIAEAEVGQFTIEPLMFHLAGIPSYLLMAELAFAQVLHGDLPRPTYPPKLREQASTNWWNRADMLFGYAENSSTSSGRVTQCLGLLAQATMMAAHAVMAAEGRWVTNEKRLISDAGLGSVDDLLTDLGKSPENLASLIVAARNACGSRLTRGGS